MTPIGKFSAETSSQTSQSSRSVNLLHIAATQLAERELPPFASGVVAMLALSIMGIIATSPEDEAERLQAIATIARRK